MDVSSKPIDHSGSRRARHTRRWPSRGCQSAPACRGLRRGGVLSRRSVSDRGCRTPEEIRAQPGNARTQGDDPPGTVGSRPEFPERAATDFGDGLFLGDERASIVIFAMVVLAITTAFVQEHRSNGAAAQFGPWCTPPPASGAHQGSRRPVPELPMERLVPGDVVRLSAGDMIPADLRLLEAKDLFINQSTLTGEAMPAEKYGQASEDPCETPSTCRTCASWARTSCQATAPA